MNQTHSTGAAQASSTAGLRVVANDGPVMERIRAIAAAQAHTTELKERLFTLLRSVLAPGPANGVETLPHPVLDTELDEVLFLRLAEQEHLNRELNELCERIRL